MNHPDPNTTPLPTHNPQPQFKLFQLFSSPESLVQVKRRGTLPKGAPDPNRQAPQAGAKASGSPPDALAAPASAEDTESHGGKRKEGAGIGGVEPSDVMSRQPGARGEAQPAPPGPPGSKGGRCDTWQVPDPGDIMTHPTAPLNEALAGVHGKGKGAPPPTPLDGEKHGGGEENGGGGGGDGDGDGVEVHANIELEIELLEQSIAGFDLNNPEEAMMVPILQAKIAELSATAGVVRQLRHHFGPFFAHFSAPPHPHTRCGPWSTWCPRLARADWCLQSDVMSNLGCRAPAPGLRTSPPP